MGTTEIFKCPENLRSMAFDALDHGELPENCFDEDGNIVADKLTPEFLEKVADSKTQYLRMRGPSKEHRFDLPIVSMALIIDGNGFPYGLCRLRWKRV